MKSSHIVSFLIVWSLQVIMRTSDMVSFLTSYNNVFTAGNACACHHFLIGNVLVLFNSFLLLFCSDMTNLDQIIDAKPQNSVSSIYHIEVQSGMIMKDFYKEIDRRYSMGLPSSPSYIKQTVGGVVSTTSHGTGQDHQSLVS